MRRSFLAEAKKLVVQNFLLHNAGQRETIEECVYGRKLTGFFSGFHNVNYGITMIRTITDF